MKTVLAMISASLALPLLAAQPMPLVIPGAEPGVPVWRDARTFDAKGEANPPLLPQEAERLKALLSRPADPSGCVRLGASDPGDYALGPHKPTFAGEGPKLARLFQAAQLVLTARVVGVTQGFADGVPGTLAELEPVDVLFSARALVAQRYFVALPSATFSVGGTSLCKTSDVYPQAAPGSEVLLFVADFWGDTGQVFRVSHLQVMPLPERGEVRLPWNLEATGAKEPPRERRAMLEYLRGLSRERTATLAASTPAGGTPSL
jgi:hypothetical protein